MRRILLGLALFSVLASVAYAAGGSANAPLYVRPWQGDTRDFKEVTCTMSIYFYNTHGSNFVTLCPRAAASAQCNDATDGFTLKSGTGFTSNVSVAGAWSCKGDTTSVVVEVYIERDYGTSPNPTPTPLT